MAITPIQPGSVTRVDRLTKPSDAPSEARLSSELQQDETTNDLSLQAARKSSLLYQVVEKLIANENLSNADSQEPVFDRLLSSRLANNQAFIGQLETTTSRASNIVYINAYQQGAETNSTQIGSVIDIKEEN